MGMAVVAIILLFGVKYDMFPGADGAEPTVLS